MDCRRFEQDLERLSCGTLPEFRQRQAEAHAATCEACGELLALAMLPTATDQAAGFVAAVVARTSGSPCESAAASLPARVDGTLEVEEHALVAGHLASCAECAELLAVLEAVGRELPSLAQVLPDARFVEDVLKRTLPVNVQLRRWWGRAWPKWLHRPRFASELAYIGSLVIVLVVATPGSPLEAVPRRALAAVSRPDGARLDLEGYLETPVGAVQALAQSSSVERVGGWIAAGVGKASQADEVVGGAAQGLATFWREAASLMGNDGGEAARATPEIPETNEENP